jgi:sarcosine oxidase/sarcosine oxidase/L-pipecolate oxidase
LKLIATSDLPPSLPLLTLCRYEAEKLVIAAGAWTNHLVPFLDLEYPRLNLTIWQMLTCYFKVTDPDILHPLWVSFSFNEPDSPWNEIKTQDVSLKTGVGVYYGFPESAWERPGYIMVAPNLALDQYANADDATFIPNNLEIKATENWVSKHIVGVNNVAEFTSTALSTITVDGEFVCDLVPAHPNIAIFTAGWGMKFVPIFGDILTKLVFGLDIDPELRKLLEKFCLGREKLKPTDQPLDSQQKFKIALKNIGMF